MNKRSLFLNLVAGVCVLAAVLVSCEREGVYAPQRKISKIYFDNGSGKKLEQVWTWNGKRLESITYPEHYILEFHYNKKNQMDSIFVRWWEIIDLASHTPQIGFSPDYSEYYVLTYDKTGKHIETLDYHRYINEHNHPLQWYPWEHYIFEYNADDLISGYLVEITYFSSSYRNNEQDLTNNVLSLLFPEMPDCRMATPFPECNSEKDAYQYRKRVSFTYEGGNVVHAESKEMDGFEEEEVYDYTYTSYPNPFFKMFVNRSPFLPYNAQSPNLVQTIRVQEFLSPMIVPVSTEIWEYEMEKDFPVKATCHGEVNYEGIEGDTIYLTKTYTWTYYYEYVE